MLDRVEGRPQYGISRVHLTFGGAPVEGIAMIVVTHGPGGLEAESATSTSKWITSSWAHAKEWYLDRGASKSDLVNLQCALRESDEESSNF
jgi:hypothetical protein